MTFKPLTENLIEVIRRVAHNTRQADGPSVIHNCVASAFEALALDLEKTIIHRSTAADRTPSGPWKPPFRRGPDAATNGRPPTTPQLLELYEAEKRITDYLDGRVDGTSLLRAADSIRLAVRIMTGRDYINPLTEKKS